MRVAEASDEIREDKADRWVKGLKERAAREATAVFSAVDAADGPAASAVRAACRGGARQPAGPGGHHGCG